MADTYPCPHCQQTLGRTEATPPGSKVRCPSCDNTLTVPPEETPRKATVEEGRVCPSCQDVLPKGAALCLRCGERLPLEDAPPRQRKRRRQRTKNRTWDGDLAMTHRVIVAVVCAGLSLAIAIALIVMDHVGGGIAAFVLGGTFSALSMGTFPRVELIHDHRDLPFLNVTHHLCFIPLRKEKVNPRKFAKIVVEHTGDSSGVQALVLLTLFLCCGVFPGLLYLFLFSGRYQVSLAEAETLNSAVVYRGWSEQRMRDVSETLAETTGLEIG